MTIANTKCLRAAKTEKKQCYKILISIHRYFLYFKRQQKKIVCFWKQTT